jgi:predicted membrane protein
MDRAATPWLSFADWRVAMTRDLPWSLFVTTSLGQVQLDLSGLVMQRAVIATGFGDVRLVCPEEAFEPLYVRSALGNIHIIVPPGYRVQVKTSGSAMFRVHADENRYTVQEKDVYLARDAEGQRSLIEIDISGTFGDAYLA